MTDTTFNQTRLAGHRVLVEGAYADRFTVLDSAEYDHMYAEDAFTKATEEFDLVVAEFFAPITAAADRLHEELEAEVVENPYVVVVQDEVQPTVGQPRQTILVSHDTAVLRILNSGDTSKLVWLGNTIEILA